MAQVEENSLNFCFVSGGASCWSRTRTCKSFKSPVSCFQVVKRWVFFIVESLASGSEREREGGKEGG